MDQKFFRTPESLLEAAQNQANKAPELYREPVRLYFITRFLAPYYEAALNAAPTAVWNEYRNALDHYMRHLTLEPGEEKNIKRMQGHMQRAVLDICKMYCHFFVEALEVNIEKDTPEVLRMVRDGNFYPELITGIADVRDYYARTKTIDIQLGGSKEDSELVLVEYINCAYKVLNLYWMYSELRPDIANAASYKSNLEANAVKNSKEPFWKKIGEHLLGHGIYYLLAAGVGSAFTFFLS